VQDKQIFLLDFRQGSKMPFPVIGFGRSSVLMKALAKGHEIWLMGASRARKWRFTDCLACALQSLNVCPVL
jgi:hypothetical protein